MYADVPLYRRNYTDAVRAYCRQNGIDVRVVFDTNITDEGWYDHAHRTIRLGAPALEMPDWAGYYLVYRLLVQAHQMLRPADFAPVVAKSAQYRLDGSVAAKWTAKGWREVSLGEAWPHPEAWWQAAADNMPYRVDAAERAREEAYDMLTHDCARDNLNALHYMASPKTSFDVRDYKALFAEIDALLAK